MQMKTHDPSTIFAPVGPYTHGLEVVEARRLLFITGTMGLDKDGRAPDGIEAQCALAWRNISAILAEAGMSVRNLVKVTCYLADRSYREANMKARAAALGDHRVATTVIAAALLEDGWLVEIEAIAAA
ncbi:RidA family protein [Dongia deserti]|uniref:RidA family protein n=1 Tax=Dongia deserti TaxID=2268030 RepID=UPI000E64CBEB|nr:RidA family protein [Dongia deserti]